MSRSAAFLERNLRDLSWLLQHAGLAEESGGVAGYLQALDPRSKLLGCALLLLAVSLCRQWQWLGGLLLLSLWLVWCSALSFRHLACHLWLAVLMVSGSMALPALFLVPGRVLWHLPLLSWPITWQGCQSALWLTGRAECSATLLWLLILTTPWSHLLKAMRALGLPLVVVAMLGMTQRYIFLLLELALQMMMARRSRVVAPMPRRARRRLLLATMGGLFIRALELGNEVHQAMISRGYRGESHLLLPLRYRWQDWGCVAFCALLLLLMVEARG